MMAGLTFVSLLSTVAFRSPQVGGGIHGSIGWAEEEIAISHEVIGQAHT